jgi:hypothetical protein
MRAMFESGMTASAIFEPLKSCPAKANATEMQRLLFERDFDLAGVQETKDGDVLGYVERSVLVRGLVCDHLRPFGQNVLVSNSTPLADLLSVFQQREFVFVLAGTKVAGVITRADLYKPPVRIYLFGLVSLFEMHMGFWIRSQYPGESWQGKISEARLREAHEFHEERKRRNEEIALLDCLQFSDKRDLLLKSKALRDMLHIASRNEGEKHLKQAESLRNQLAHSQENFTTGTDWAALIETADWLERTLRVSDEVIERHALESSRQFVDELWS